VKLIVACRWLRRQTIGHKSYAVREVMLILLAIRFWEEATIYTTYALCPPELLYNIYLNYTIT